MNYHEKFLNMIDSSYLEELLKNTPGSEETEKAKNTVLKLIEKDQKGKEMLEKFLECLALHQELWFNIGWSLGWSGGAATVFKLARMDSPDISRISKAMKNMKLDTD